MSADPNVMQAQLDALARRRALAQAMAQQTGQPEQQQVVNGRVMDQGLAPALRGITSILAQGRANAADRQATQLQGQIGQAKQRQADSALQALLAGPEPQSQQQPEMSPDAALQASLSPTPTQPLPPTVARPMDAFLPNLAKANAALRAGVPEPIVDSYIRQNQAMNKPPEGDPSSLREWAAFNKMTDQQKAQYLQMKRAEQFKLSEVGGVPNVVTTGAGANPNAPRVTATPLTTLDAQAHGKATVAGAEAGAKETGKGLAERQLDMPRAKSAMDSSTQAVDTLISSANEILNHPSLSKISGLQGNIFDMPGGDAADARALLNGLKRRVAVAALTQMRESSKTGGAVGNVTEKEWPILESQLANLDEKKLNVDGLKRELKKVIELSEKSKARIRTAYDQTYGTQQAPQQQGGIKFLGFE